MPTTPLLLGLERSLPSTSPFFHPTQPLAAAAESSTLPLLPHLLLCAKAAAKSHPSSPLRSSLAATTIASHPLSIAASAEALRRRCRHMFGVEAPSKRMRSRQRDPIQGGGVQAGEASATRSCPKMTASTANPRSFKAVRSSGNGGGSLRRRWCLISAVRTRAGCASARGWAWSLVGSGSKPSGCAAAW